MIITEWFKLKFNIHSRNIGVALRGKRTNQVILGMRPGGMVPQENLHALRLLLASETDSADS